MPIRQQWFLFTRTTPLSISLLQKPIPSHHHHQNLCHHIDQLPKSSKFFENLIRTKKPHLNSKDRSNGATFLPLLLTPTTSFYNDHSNVLSPIPHLTTSYTSALRCALSHPNPMEPVTSDVTRLPYVFRWGEIHHRR